jgi:tRNA(Ile)-lysidine synthase
VDEPTAALIARCAFPPAGARVDLAVSGGGDSLGLLLLALEAGLAPTVHHVNHHARAASDGDAALVASVGARLGVSVVVHDVDVAPGANFESRARAARRASLPAGAMTGHTMDDLAETMVLNLLRGAGVDGLSPMVGDPTKPLLALRRGEVRGVVARAEIAAAVDESNDDPSFARNRVRAEVLPLLNDVAGRDVVPLLARAAGVLAADRRWLDALADGPDLAGADCRELSEWPEARLRRWLRARLVAPDAGDGAHPPSAAEVERALGVVRGEATATELAGGRRLSRSGQRLVLG